MLTHVEDRKSTRLNSSHMSISYAVFCLKKKRTCSGYPARTHRPRLWGGERGASSALRVYASHYAHYPPSPPAHAIGSLSLFFFLKDAAPPEIYPFPSTTPFR